MSIVMLIVVSRSINKAYFWGKHNFKYLYILHQFGVVVHLLFFVGVYNCKS